MSTVLIVAAVRSLVGIAATADVNATDGIATICPCVEQVKCTTMTTLTEIVFFIVSLLAISRSAPFLYSWYRKSDCEFRLSRWRRDENNAGKFEDVSIDIRLEECDATAPPFNRSTET